MNVTSFSPPLPNPTRTIANSEARQRDELLQNDAPPKELEALRKLKSRPQNNDLIDGLKVAKEQANGIKRGLLKSRLQELTKRFAQLKKLGAGYPKLMMRELREIVKEVKSLSKEYGDLLKSETGMVQNAENLDEESAKTDAMTALELEPKDEFLEGLRIIITDSKHIFKILKARIEMTKKDGDNDDIIKDTESEIKDANEEFSNTEEIQRNLPQNPPGSLVSIAA